MSQTTRSEVGDPVQRRKVVSGLGRRVTKRARVQPLILWQLSVLSLVACSGSDQRTLSSAPVAQELTTSGAFEEAGLSDPTGVQLEPEREPVKEVVRTKGTVVPSQLPKAILGSVALVVREGPWANSEILYESRDREDLESLAKAAVVLELAKNVHSSHCACYGTPAIFLEQPTGEPLVLTNHHCRAVRFTLWNSDARLAEGLPWANWFNERGMPGPKADVDKWAAR